METGPIENETTNGMNPLLMEDIVSHLVKFLDLENSKNSRLVCKLWNDEIQKIFFKNRVMQVPENFYVKFGSNDEEKNAELDKLEFFSSVGKIQALKFRDHRDTPCFIRLSLPWEKIDKLILRTDQVDMKQEINAKAFEELLKLAQRVKHIKMDWAVCCGFPGMKFLDLILSAAERREEKEGNLKFSPPILLSELHLEIKTREDLDKMRQLSDSSMIQLQYLACSPIFNVTTNPTAPSELKQMLEKILDTNKNVLLGFHILNRFGTIAPPLKIPLMSQIKNITLSLNPATTHQQFGFYPDFQFHRNMPKLTTVGMALGSGRNGLAFWNSFFENIEPAPSVKYLQLSSRLDLGFVPNKMFQTFCSIESLKLRANVSVDFVHVGQCCLRLKNLILFIPKEEDESKLLLSRISGFSLDTIEKCLKSADVENIEDLRLNPSLLHLPGLKIFTLIGSKEESESFKKYLPLVRDLILNRIPHVKLILA